MPHKNKDGTGVWNDCRRLLYQSEGGVSTHLTALLLGDEENAKTPTGKH